MTADEFEHLDDWQTELWIARRFGELMDGGFAPSEALLLAVRPEVDVPTAVALRHKQARSAPVAA